MNPKEVAGSGVRGLRDQWNVVLGYSAHYRPGGRPQTGPGTTAGEREKARGTGHIL